MPISDCEVRDPRVRRTRQLLQGALGQLMDRKGFEEITVQDIAETATVNRATFYDHYTDKYDLLDAMVAGGFHILMHERHISFDGTCTQALKNIITTTCDYLEIVHAGKACTERQKAVQPLVDAAITLAIGRALLPGICQQHGKLSAEIIAAGASGALYGALKQWYFLPARVPATEIVEPILELVLPLLQYEG